MRHRFVRVWPALILLTLPAVVLADPPVTPAKEESRVKTATVSLSGSRHVSGVVDVIDADGITVVEIPRSGEPKEHRFRPNDVLRDGKVMSGATPRCSYRWEDVKRGDTVELRVAEDHIDKQMYCVEIRIERRPKGKLPESQKAKEDENYPWLRVYNDIENGEDVSDEEIKTAFPPRTERRDDRGNLHRSAYPGGLPKEWQVKLDAIRAKKKDDPKAKPPEKKDDKK